MQEVKGQGHMTLVDVVLLSGGNLEGSCIVLLVLEHMAVSENIT